MKKAISSHFQLGIDLFTRRLWKLTRQPVFIVLTVVGNGLIVLSSALLYYFEKGLNPRIQTWLDAIWWAVATVTTVGYGDVSPITNIGKVIGIFMMIVGTALFWSYTALFAGAIMAEETKEILDLESETNK
ncbi:MAG: potassium channel family protein [Bdellovibrionaceae bacterium]|nr:potassium channel family protein [Pseudobdellovibrionaceae bacterium]